MHALIIDDSRTMRSILKRIVHELGFETSEAANGQEALDILESGLQADLCLIDWNMPLMDGYTFVMCTNGQIWNSDLNSVEDWTLASVQYVTAQKKPDAGVGIALYQNSIVAFSSSSM